MSEEELAKFQAYGEADINLMPLYQLLDYLRLSLKMISACILEIQGLRQRVYKLEYRK